MSEQDIAMTELICCFGGMGKTLRIWTLKEFIYSEWGSKSYSRRNMEGPSAESHVECG